MNILILIALITTAIEMATCFICTHQLGFRKLENGDNARWLLSFGALLSGLLAVFVIFGNLVMQTTSQEPLLLRPWIGLVYMTMHIVMTLYPITIVRQDWLTPKHYALLFSPVVLFAIIFLFFVGRWTVLETPASVWENANRVDVIVRLASLFIMAPYCLILFWLPYSYKKSSATLGWIIGYSFGLTLICAVHIVLMLTYSPVLMTILPLLASAFYYLSTRYELTERIIPPQPEDNADTEDTTLTELKPLEGVAPEFGLWSRVSQIMDKQEAWKNPDLSLSELASLSGTNTTYLNRVIKQEVGMSFKDYLNNKRVNYVATQLRKKPDLDIQEAFFNAGFRSRTTAWRNFKDIIGTTPTEFKQTLR